MLQQDIPLPWHVHPYAATALGKQVYNSQFFGDVDNGQAPAVADALLGDNHETERIDGGGSLCGCGRFDLGEFVDERGSRTGHR